MTLVPVLIYATVCVTIFFVLRRKLPRVYAPRSYLSSLEPQYVSPSQEPANRFGVVILRKIPNRCSERSPKLPSGWFNWVKTFYQIPDTTVLNHSSIDGFLFLRYLKIVCIICGVGCLITWPILIPLHVMGGAGNAQMDRLTFGNVIHPSWYFVHAFLAWIYFGMIDSSHYFLATDKARLHLVYRITRVRLLHQSASGISSLAILRQPPIFKDGSIYLRASANFG